jgi:DNA-binding transcriptional LysR family regulator
MAPDVFPVDIVVTIPMMKFNLPELFDSFRAVHTDTTLNVQHFELVEEAFDEFGGYPNLLLTYQTKPYQSIYSFEPLYRDQLVAILPCEDDLPTDQISLLDYMDNDIYLTSRSLRQEILDYFLPTGVVPKLVNITSGPRREISMRKVINGHGISICYKSDISIYKINSLKVCSIKEFPSCAFCLGIKKDHTPSNHEQMLISTLISYSHNDYLCDF